MRIVKLLPILVIALLGTGSTGMAATRPRQGPVVLYLKWHLVARSVLNVIANDRYVFVGTTADLLLSSNPQQGILLDRRTGRRTSIDGPCNPQNPAGGRGSADGLPYFGGPWLMLQCVDAAHLYNLSSGQRTVVSAPASLGQQPTCPSPPEFPGTSQPAYVGTYWIRWGCELQNISTGVVRSDPVASGGRIYDDLSVPSGVARLCSPLRYPGPQGVLRFYDGRFALIGKQSGGPGDDLLRCGSRFNLTMRTLPPGAPVDSQAIAWSAAPTKRGQVIQGLFLPDLRRFLIHLPHQFGSMAAPVALSQRTVYVQTAGFGGELWAADLPKSP